MYFITSLNSDCSFVMRLILRMNRWTVLWKLWSTQKNALKKNSHCLPIARRWLNMCQSSWRPSFLTQCIHLICSMWTNQLNRINVVHLFLRPTLNQDMCVYLCQTRMKKMQQYDQILINPFTFTRFTNLALNTKKCARRIHLIG